MTKITNKAFKNLYSDCKMITEKSNRQKNK